MNPFDAPVDETPDCVIGRPHRGDADAVPERHVRDPRPLQGERAIAARPGAGTRLRTAPFAGETTEIRIADFVYAPGDLSTVGTLGVPKVPLGSNLRFTNLDGGGILHTITSCEFPCLGATGAAFPIADGETSAGRPVELDSGQLGYSVPEISGAKNELDWTIPVNTNQGYQPGEIVTYFCRIHPSMRGAFEVTE